ncbi:MAG: type II toxin-antitoxin system VapC family toxin [Hyphomonadaceae bacterium]|nr:type II toxin-antitoxin system VapC family toxin [Hyphomonadaceae bacterium]
MFLLDTMVVSEPTKKRSSPKVLTWLSQQSSLDLFLSTVTLGEVVYGIERLPPGPERSRLQVWRDQLFVQPGAPILLPVDELVSVAWGRLRASLPRTLPIIDSLVAATAMAHSLTIVTRNVRDFAALGVPVLNPWA